MSDASAKPGLDRFIVFERIPNFRDFGGHATVSGGRVKRGQLFRSAGLHNASDADLIKLETLGLDLVIDLRRRHERVLEPSRRPANFSATVIENDDPDLASAPHIAIASGGPPDPVSVHGRLMDYYRATPFDARHQALFGAGLKAAADAKGPLLIHCAAGKDRTGIMSGLILHALGVHSDDITGEYLLTEHADLRRSLLDSAIRMAKETGRVMPPESLDVMLSAQADFIESAGHAMREKSGSVDSYLDSLGCDERMRARLRDRLVA